MPFGWLNWRLFRFFFNTFVYRYLLLFSEKFRWDVILGQSCCAWRSRFMAESEQCSVCSHQQMQNIPMSEKLRKNPSNAEQKKSKLEVFPLTSIPCLNLSGWVGTWLWKEKMLMRAEKLCFHRKDFCDYFPLTQVFIAQAEKAKVGKEKGPLVARSSSRR